jgi:hypothetical protein
MRHICTSGGMGSLEWGVFWNCAPGFFPEHRRQYQIRLSPGGNARGNALSRGFLEPLPIDGAFCPGFFSAITLNA